MRYLPLLRRLSDDRGGAMVEMAISMLVFVPIMLYALMLDDLLRYRLNLQEAVISAQWDFTTRDYEKGSNHEQDVRWGTQMLYCDHSAAYDSYDKSTDCDGEGHHQALAAHQCWLQPDKHNQVNCSKVDDELLTSLSTGSLGPANALVEAIQNGSHGGEYRCWARLSVVNEMITNDFMQQFSKNKMIEDGTGTASGNGGAGLATSHQSGGAVHGISDGYFLYPWYRTAILTDTWAVNTVSDVDQDDKESGIFYERVRAAYRGGAGYWAFAATAQIFLAKAWADELLFPMMGGIPIAKGDGSPVIPDGSLIFGDNVFFPDMAVKHGGLKDRFGVGSGSSSRTPENDVSEEGGKKNYNATPWRDWDNDRYQKTYESSDRGKWYMGCKDKESC